MEYAKFLKMAKNVPAARVQISETRWAGTFSINAYLFTISAGFVGYVLYAGDQNFNPYNYKRTRTTYRSEPDYLSGQSIVYKTTVPNVIRDY